MGSLTAHLREAGDHGHLRFHPSCPVCRQERLYGALSSEPVVSLRAQALLAGGVLALSASAPVVAAAQEPDRQVEGVAAPEQSGEAELDDPTFDPGGDTSLSYDTAPVPGAPGDGADSGEGAPLDLEPSVDLDGQLAPLAETEAPATDEDAVAPPAEGVPPAEGQPPGVEVTTGAPTVPNPGDRAPSPDADERPAGEQRPDRGLGPLGSDRGTYEREPGTDRSGGAVPDRPPSVDSGPPVRSSPGTGGATHSRPHVDAVDPAAPVPAAPVEATAPASAGPVEASAPAVPVPTSEPVTVAQANAPASNSSDEQALEGNARSYVVQPGDSLWSIAKRLLGGEASPARIAREVHRLWSLNSSRIGTGDPDLLMVGTRLQLR
jgi:LysM domain